MGQIFTLGQDEIDTMAKAIDDLILYLGKNCKLVYPPKVVPCSNCVRDPIGNKSKNFYLHGGPMPFLQGSICPVCDGSGALKSTEVYDIVRMIVTWHPAKFMNTKLDAVRLASGVIKVKGYLTDLPKLQECSYMIPHVEIAAYNNYRFRLAGEGISGGNIVQGRYFTALLDRIQS